MSRNRNLPSGAAVLIALLSAVMLLIAVSCKEPEDPGYPAGDPIERISSNPAGEPANADSGYSSLSSDGRYVVFDSSATDLVAGTTNTNMYLYDRQTDTLEIISTTPTGDEGNGDSYYGVISDDGNTVGFISYASDLVASDSNGTADVFLYDRLTDTTILAGPEADNLCDLSADGRYLAFQTNTALVAGDTTGHMDIYVYDVVDDIYERISLDSEGNELTENCYEPVISADGRWVAFLCDGNLTDEDVNDYEAVYLADRQSGDIILVSRPHVSGTLNGESEQISISAGGRYIAFRCEASNLMGTADTNSSADIFVYDRETDTMYCPTSDSISGVSSSPSISSDGQYVAFSSSVSTLVAGDTNGREDIFVYDMNSDDTVRVNLAASGTQGDSSAGDPRISANGNYVSFDSSATNLLGAGEDTVGNSDIFVASRL